MFKLNKFALAACAWTVVAMPAAMAADMPPVYEPVPVPPKAFAGWYLRGDIGYGNQDVDDLDNVLIDDFDRYDQGDLEFDGGPIFGAGIGYRFNNWFRADVTGEYRAKVDFKGHDIGVIENGPGPDDDDIFTNDYDAKKSEWLFLANVYADLGNYRGISPYVGAGIGAARTTIHGFTDTGMSTIPTTSLAYGDDESEWNLAWALYAGVGFEVTPAMTLDVGYRFLHLGDAESGDLVAFDGTNNVDNPMEFENLTSHDIRVGFRYMFW